MKRILNIQSTCFYFMKVNLKVFLQVANFTFHFSLTCVGRILV